MNQITNSSSIAEYGYNEPGQPKGTLSIVFVKGQTIYDFFDVPAEKAEGLEKAESKGSYFYAEIKGKYKFQKREM